MLYRFLEHNGHPLTEDGCFIAYRGVTDDFRDCRTRSIDNSVGSVVEMPREQVDDNPNNTCSYGLHVACFNYAEGFGPKLIEVKVNPKDVVCVPEDYEGTKMRVCRYEVVNESDNRPKNDTLYGNEVNTACVDLDDVDEDFLHEDEEWSPFFRDDDDDLDEDELY